MFVRVEDVKTTPEPPASFDDAYAVVRVLHGVVMKKEEEFRHAPWFMAILAPVGGIDGYFRNLQNRPLTVQEIVKAFTRLFALAECARLSVARLDAVQAAPFADVELMCTRLSDYFYYALSQNGHDVSKLDTRHKS